MAIDLGSASAMINLGFYYKYLEKDYNMMKKYYLMAIELGTSNAMLNLGNYYKDLEKDYNMMKKYYLMAIDLGSASAMINLGFYYQTLEKDYNLMKKYYLMAIELGNVSAMNNLGDYYQTLEKDYDKMKKYYLMAIGLGNQQSMNNLGNYYQTVEKDYNLMEKYFIMAIELENLQAMNNLQKFYKSKINEFFEKLLSIENKNKLIEDKLSEISKTLEYKNEIIKNSLILDLYKESKDTFFRDIVEYIPQDFLLKVISENEKRNYFIHSFILDSEYFKILMNGKFERKKKLKIEVAYFETIDYLLEYLYTGVLDETIPETNLEDLKEIADIYAFIELYKLCNIFYYKYHYRL